MTNKICKISLFSCILAAVAAMPADAAIKMKNSNRSYADAYNQVNAMRYQQEYMETQIATTASSTSSLPVAVDDEKLANAILSNDESVKTTVADLDSCAMIYPNGVFKWATPESGIRRNQSNQCVAVVELRDANTNAVLATTTLAAGDAMKCNIDYFPESGLNMSALLRVILPADSAPTMADVESVMNEEQKQNAGLKIAAAALISGVAGNILAPKEAGSKTGIIPIGTGESQLVGTAIGAAAGAGIMAASTYSGKVAGDTIKSTAVNAASGMIIGNMLAGASGGDNFLTIVKCNIPEGADKGEHDCIAGRVQTIGETLDTEKKLYLIKRNFKEIKVCLTDATDCEDYHGTLANNTIRLVGADNITLSEIAEKGDYINRLTAYVPNLTNPKEFVTGSTTNEDAWFKIASANTVSGEQHAYAVFTNGSLNSVIGYKLNDWKSLESKAKYYVRYSDGSVGKQISPANKDQQLTFDPMQRDASSGGLIDLSNKARLKGTAVGAATGGALGGFAGYEGAKSEITDRWTSAQREYEDSLSNFVCMTGGRYLAKYNDYAEIPQPHKAQ